MEHKNVVKDKGCRKSGIWIFHSQWVSFDDFGPVNRSSNMFRRYCRHLQAGDEAQSRVTWAVGLFPSSKWPPLAHQLWGFICEALIAFFARIFQRWTTCMFWSDWLTSYQAGSKKLASLMMTVEDWHILFLHSYLNNCHTCSPWHLIDMIHCQVKSLPTKIITK